MRHPVAVAALLVSLVLSACESIPETETISDAPLVVTDAVDPPTAAAATTLFDPNGELFRPVHATLLPDGRVMMVSTGSTSIAGAFTPNPVYTGSPATITLSSENVARDASGETFGNYTVADTLFCGGQTLLADGSLFYAGGTRVALENTTGTAFIVGLSYATTYANGVWSRVANDMIGTGDQGTSERWYPATTRLRDGRVLVTSGRDLVMIQEGDQTYIGTKNRSSEIYDPATKGWTLVQTHANTSEEVYNSDFTHAFVLPYDSPYDVLALGEAGVPQVLSLSIGPHWFSTGENRPGTAVDANGVRLETPNVGASSLMLPIRVSNGEFGYYNGSLFVAGGTFNREHENSYDVYDPILAEWQERRPLASRRHHPSTIILPDGQILILAGHDDSEASPLVRHASLVNPRTNFARDDGITDLGEVRGYHTVSVLLPDGRVLLAGGRSAGAGGPDDEKPTMRYYYPPYMFQARPAIVSAPTQLGFGSDFGIAWAGGDLREVVLVGLGSMTHSVDLNQRHIQLEVVATNATNKTATVRGPAGGWIAPPGHYMLFVLDENLTPSMGQIVSVQ